MAVTLERGNEPCLLQVWPRAGPALPLFLHHPPHGGDGGVAVWCAAGQALEQGAKAHAFGSLHLVGHGVESGRLRR